MPTVVRPRGGRRGYGSGGHRRLLSGIATHYDSLGVRADASAEEIRAAHRDLARRHHPDRLYGRPSAEIRAGEARLREVNAAWSVLGDPARRRAYDEGRATRPRSASSRGRPAPADPHDVDPVAEEQPVGFAVALLRALPLATVIGLLGLIFVFTAFANRSADPAGGDEEPAADVFAVGDCVQTLRQLRVHPCDGGHDAVIESLVAEQVDCTPPLQAWRLPELSGVACLAMYTG